MMTIDRFGSSRVGMHRLEQFGPLRHVHAINMKCMVRADIERLAVEIGMGAH